MKNKFSKLQKLLKNKKLDPTHIEEHRDCDATIAILLGFTDVEQDPDKEWTADVPSSFKEFDCVGRCVVPKFTGVDGLKLYNYILKKEMFIEPVLSVTYNRKTGTYTAMLYDTEANLKEIEGTTFSLAVCRLLVLMLTDTKPKKTRKKRNVKKTKLG